MLGRLWPTPLLPKTKAFEHGERTSKQDRQPDISDEGFSLIHGTLIKSRISRILGSGAVLSSCQKSFCWGATLVWAPRCLFWSEGSCSETRFLNRVFETNLFCRYFPVIWSQSVFFFLRSGYGSVHQLAPAVQKWDFWLPRSCWAQRNSAACSPTRWGPKDPQRIPQRSPYSRAQIVVNAAISVCQKFQTWEVPDLWLWGPISWDFSISLDLQDGTTMALLVVWDWNVGVPTDAKHLLQAALELLGPNSSAVSFGAALGAFEPGSAAATAEMVRSWHWRFQTGYIHKPSQPHGQRFFPSTTRW